MNYMSLEEFQKTEEYQEFIKENPNIGTLKVQVFTADQAIPVADADVYISKQIGNDHVLFFQGVTNSSCIIDNIKLPEPEGNIDIEEVEIPKYTVYDLTVRSKTYNDTKKYRISMFGGDKVLQYVKIVPNGIGG